MSTAPGPQQGQSTYFIDAESAAEMARLTHQDALATRGMGGLLPEFADLSRIERVLDFACGPGGWALDLARTYPHMKVTGGDISQIMIRYAQAQAQVRELSNATFKLMSAFEPLDLPANSFDLVNARFIVGFMAPSSWPPLLQQLFAVCRSGGFIRLTEGEMPFTNSRAFGTLNGVFAHAYALAGRCISSEYQGFSITPILGRLLQDAGCQHVRKQVYTIDFSAGTAARDGFYQDFMIGFPLSLPFCLKMGVITQGEFDALYQEAMADVLSDDFCGVIYLLTAIGEKP